MRPGIHHQLKLGPQWFLEYLTIMFMFLWLKYLLSPPRVLNVSPAAIRILKISCISEVIMLIFLQGHGLGYINCFDSNILQTKSWWPNLGGFGFVDNLMKSDFLKTLQD